MKPDRILIVKDDPDQVSFFMLALSRAGYQVAAVPHAEAALDLLPNPSFDLLLTDWHLRGMPGDALINAWHAQAPSCHTLLMSCDMDVQAAAATCGADGFLRKPVDLTALYARVDEVLHAPPSPS